MLADEADAVLVQGYTIRRYPKLADTPALIVVDLYDPWLFENLEIHSDNPDADEALRNDAGVLNELLDLGDFFICASERQRDYWLGMLSARGRLDAATYAEDPSLRRLIDIVPFGLPDRPPRHLQPVLKGVHPKVGPDDKVVLWGGGAWDWFDPLTVIEAFKIVVERVPNARLYFLGLQLPSGDVAPMRMAEMAVRRAEELGLAGESVIFGDWTPYELREAFLLESDVGISAARDLAETRLAFRSRILDYIWAGVPIVSTSGDVLSDLVQDEGLGLVVPPGNPGLLAHALIRMLGNDVLRAQCSARVRAIADDFTWNSTVEPLRRLANEPWRWRRARNGGSPVRPLADDGQQLLAHWRRMAMASDTHLRSYVRDLERTIEHQNRRLAPLRNSPAYPVFRAAKRLVRREKPDS
jgi:glycosyltransferase involved in cell wall biosynthesis